MQLINRNDMDLLKPIGAAPVCSFVSFVVKTIVVKTIMVKTVPSSAQLSLSTFSAAATPWQARHLLDQSDVKHAV